MTNILRTRADGILLLLMVSATLSAGNVGKNN